MQNEPATLCLHQQILSAPDHGTYRLSGQRCIELSRDGTTQVLLTDHHLSDCLAKQVRSNTAADGLDLGKFGHGMASPLSSLTCRNSALIRRPADRVNVSGAAPRHQAAPCRAAWGGPSRCR